MRTDYIISKDLLVCDASESNTNSKSQANFTETVERNEPRGTALHMCESSESSANHCSPTPFSLTRCDNQYDFFSAQVSAWKLCCQCLYIHIVQGMQVKKAGISVVTEKEKQISWSLPPLLVPSSYCFSTQTWHSWPAGCSSYRQTGDKLFVEHVWLLLMGEEIKLKVDNSCYSETSSLIRLVS